MYVCSTAVAAVSNDCAGCQADAIVVVALTQQHLTEGLTGLQVTHCLQLYAQGKS